MTNLLPFPIRAGRVDCYIFKHGDWVPAHLSMIRKGNWFRLIGGDKTFIADEDAVENDDGWDVDAHYHGPSRG